MTYANAAAFIEYCRIQRSLSDNTLRAYKQDLEAYLRFRALDAHSTDTTRSTTAYLSRR